MAWDKGFACRATSGFVTDAATDTYVLSADTYPTVRNGTTFGWDVSPTSVDDLNSLDARLAGYATDTVQRTLRIDLPEPATYTIRIASGVSSAGVFTYLVVQDDATALFVVGVTTVSGWYRDASSVQWSAAAWPGSNAGNDSTFLSTVVNVLVGESGISGYLNYIGFSQVPMSPGGLSFTSQMG